MSFKYPVQKELYENFDVFHLKVILYMYQHILNVNFKVEMH